MKKSIQVLLVIVALGLGFFLGRVTHEGCQDVADQALRFGKFGS